MYVCVCVYCVCVCVCVYFVCVCVCVLGEGGRERKRIWHQIKGVLEDETACTEFFPNCLY